MRPQIRGKSFRRKKASVPEMILLVDAFEDYMIAKEAENLRDRTLEDHRKHFDYFLRFCKLTRQMPKSVTDVTTALCREYVSYMLRQKGKWDNHPHLAGLSEEKGLSPGTVNIRIRSLKAQFNWYVNEGYLVENPWDAVPLLKVDESRLVSFKHDHVIKLLTAPDKSTFVGFRNYVLLKLLLETGGRITEVVSLDEMDVDLDGGVIEFSSDRTKRRTNRTIPITPSMVNLLKRLIRENEGMLEREPALFLTVTGNRLTASDVRRIMRDYKTRQGISNVRVSPHTCRHTFAKNFIHAGGDPFTLQMILGHSTMEMTRRYVNTNTEQVRLQLEKVQKAMRGKRRYR